MSCLPKQADFCVVVPLSPTLIVGDEPIEQPCHMDRVGMHRIDSQYRIGQPRRIVPRLSPRRAEPVLQIVPRNPRLPQPPSLIELMPRRTTDRPIGSRPERPVDELRKRVTAVRRTVRQMLRQQLPAVVVRRRDVRVRTFKERNLCRIPIPVPIIPKRLRLQLRLLIQHLSRCVVRTRERKQ